MAIGRGDFDDYRLGHPSVTRSLLRGLQINGVNFTYNSRFYDETHRWGILSSKEVLRAALSSHVVRKYSQQDVDLVVGPNVANDPRTIQDLLRHPSVTSVVVPSRWVATAYINAVPELDGSLAVWAAGVDETFWSPQHSRHRSGTLLVYLKAGSSHNSLVLQVMETLKQRGYGIAVIEYGRYSKRQFRSVLNQVEAVVWIGPSESQGIAQFEAWSMNVPTLIFRSTGTRESRVQGRYKTDSWTDHWEPGIESPYLSAETGSFWSTKDELLDKLMRFRRRLLSPRDWVLTNATDRISSQRYVELFRKTPSIT